MTLPAPTSVSVYVSVRLSVRLSVPSIDSSSDVQQVCRSLGRSRSISAAGVRAQQPAGSVVGVIRRGSTQISMVLQQLFGHRFTLVNAIMLLLLYSLSSFNMRKCT